ncbi:MAG TPA: flagellar basal body P-ring formation chaperone FlgA [Rhodanobacteraceae bacterium]|nr:flagellar basal body P-ring formation chaperone FlgA [Oleiagrimonas sp.]HET9819552.1 flagellar basal body P-ring formation chaperone FlgA [Rhodanobacteraceae bacterium]
MRVRCEAAVSAVMLLFVAGGVQAVTRQPLGTLQSAAVEAVRQAAPTGTRVVAEANELDPRLRLPACAGALQAQAPDLGRGASRVSVQVSCSAGQSWSVRVPVRVQLFRKVLVSSHGLARGDVIGAGDVHAEEYDVARLGYGYLVDPAKLSGRRLRRALTTDTVITPGMLAPREVVRRGQQVRLVVDAGSIQVSAAGIALQAGDRGDLVRVKSLSCQCEVQGRVDAPGVVGVLP